ncbi:methylated-DNA--protein-cysteine methyltransferase [Lactococcus hodotermopsidis]|uniref:Methylated-DNA--protein-cysteine methyltransferase n=1 Tax=Pseudolactococcus hodotermopsidis TaxID=2709157 RepID=A0A6A0B9I2_9LACT|nr:methylated-DNA--[protein]-cysteine S-methyltransferase [Lactococcus hodotermopsidis]GFH42099.1 methylated-DNA--protein-cysteine methyltransferase [Lactococcus hodotermopsidis]
MYNMTTYLSEIGKITLVSDGKNLNGLWLANQKYFGGRISDKWVENANLPVFDLAKKWLDSYFCGKKPTIADLPLAPIGSDFRQRVWQILCDIPYGKLITYGEIAQKLAMEMGKEKMSSQAVGGAVGHNPISLMIPCHRVVGSNGSLTGYAGGIDVKRRLLEFEGVEMSELFVP